MSVSRVPSFSLPQLLKPANVEKLALGLNALFILLGLGSLVYFAMAVADVQNTIAGSIENFEQRKKAVLALSTPTTGQNKNKKQDYSDLANRSVFGAVAPVAKENPNDKKAQETKLPLVLIGVYMPDGDAPYSIIEDEKKRAQEVFMIGDSIFDVAKLTAIHADSVEINRNGSRELLMLDSGVARAPSSDSGSGDSGEETQIAVDARELDEALQNLPTLLTQARAVPYFRDGKAVGLRLFAIRSGSLFEKIGLQNGDVLKTVNGNSMADMSQALQLFQKLKDERSVTVMLERNMAPKTFQYEIR